MVRKTLDIPDQLWERFSKLAAQKYGHYGAIKKALSQALELWIREQSP